MNQIHELFRKDPNTGLMVPYDVSEAAVFLGGKFKTRIIRDGEVIEEHPFSYNKVCNQGLNYFLDVALSGGAQISSWYIFPFKGNYTPAADDTAANISSRCTEATEYDEANRVQWIDGGVASQNVDNSGSLADFSINANIDIYGAGIVSSNSKSGTTGTLIAVTRFAAMRSVQAGDTFQIQYDFTAASST